MIAITFVDSKFRSQALAQAENFKHFGIQHEIMPIPEQTYGIELWLHLFDQTVAAIKKHGRIFRVDAEIRLLQPLPQHWHDSNVLFYIHPILSDPWYKAINTGHMILDESAIPFLEQLKFLTECLIPPNHDGSKLGFDDEDLSNVAIKLSGIKHVREVIDYDRSDSSTAACTRGDWHTPHTIFTHNFLHNWNTPGYHLNEWIFLRNHLMPLQSTQKVDAVIMGMRRRVVNASYWKSLGLELMDDCCEIDDWFLYPQEGSFMHAKHCGKKYLS